MAPFSFRVLPVFSARDATLDFEQLTSAFNLGTQIVTPEAFKEVPAFEHTWKNFEAGRKAQYRKNPFGIVELRGLISAGEVGKSAFTLPEGYRPKESWAFGVVAAGVFGELVVNSAGTVVPNTAETKTNCFLQQVSFSVE